MRTPKLIDSRLHNCQECERECETVPASYEVETPRGPVLVCDSHLDIVTEGVAL